MSMNLITVIPLTRAKVATNLSYFTASDVPIGAIVSVPLRSKSIHAIVTGSRPAADLKSEIKSAPFEIRKLGKVKATAFFPAPFIEACRQLADYYATNVGAVIDVLVSDSLLSQASKIAPPTSAQARLLKTEPAAGETYAIQADDEDRLSGWRSLIRQEFAKKRSIVFYAPTVEEATNISNSLSKGVEGYIFTLHSSLTKKMILETWTAIADLDHPVVVVATGSFAVLPRNDIDIIIIERENGRGWISQRSPYLDTRDALETIARKRRQSVYIADSMLRAETLHRIDENEILPGPLFKWRSISTAKETLVDMRVKKPKTFAVGAPKDDEKEGSKPRFRTLSPELKNLIRENQEESTHLFIVTARRGLAPLTVCDDCETVVSCKECSAPVVLHTSRETGKNFFMCHSCGARRSAAENCVTCRGWRLTPLGVGIERIHAEIKESFPDVDIIRIDADLTPSDREIRLALERFKTKPGSILLGTEMALLHLSEKVEHVAVASLDSLLALPDFRIQERIMYALIRLRTVASRSFLVQTRRPEERVFEYGLKGNLSDFYRMTIAEREQFKYPPFSVLIKITIEGKKDRIAKEMASIQALLEPHAIDVFPAFTSTVRGNYVIHGLIKIETHTWPDTELVSKLRGLPPSVSVKVNPESLL